MKPDLLAVMQKLEQQSFAEKCEYFLSDQVLGNNFASQHLIIFEIDKGDRKEIFKSALNKTSYIAYDNEVQTPESEYDYRYIEDYKFTPKKLFNLLKSHNGKLLILDANALLAKQSLVVILQGAICSTLDGSKWSVSLDGEKKFMFKGTLILLTTLAREKFTKTLKYNRLADEIRKI